MISVSDYPAVREHARSLGCREPIGLAVIPGNFAKAESFGELRYDCSVSILRDLWRLAGVTPEPLEPGNDAIPYLADSVHEWTAGSPDIFPWSWPSFYISAAFLAGSESQVQSALNAISGYLTDWFGRFPEQRKNMKLAVIVEKTSGACKRVDYEGPPGGLGALITIFREMNR